MDDLFRKFTATVIQENSQIYFKIIKNGRGAFKPTSVWGPALQKHREEWIQMKNR